MSTYYSPTKPAFGRYLASIRPKPDTVLSEMLRQAEREDIPVVSEDVGEFLYLLIASARPKRIVECGTAIGMSTLHMARALSGHRISGKIDTLDVSEERHRRAKNYLGRAGVARYVSFHTQPAVDYLRRDKKSVDLLFLDAVKEEYKDYVRLALPRMKRGSLIVVDNVLWHGFVPGARKPKGKFWTKSTKALRAFNKFFVNHPRLYARVFPVGDGLGLGVVR
ncbi:MAG: O-methyltransferase [Bdellovibrionota bacterium]